MQVHLVEQEPARTQQLMVLDLALKRKVQELNAQFPDQAHKVTLRYVGDDSVQLHVESKERLLV